MALSTELRLIDLVWTHFARHMKHDAHRLGFEYYHAQTTMPIKIKPILLLAHIEGRDINGSLLHVSNSVTLMSKNSPRYHSGFHFESCWHLETYESCENLRCNLLLMHLEENLVFTEKLLQF